MDDQTISRALKGTFPAVCEAGAAELGPGLSVRRLRSVMAELRSAIRQAIGSEFAEHRPIDAESEEFQNEFA